MIDGKLTMKTMDYVKEEIIKQANAMGENGWLRIDLPPEAKRGDHIMVPRGAFEMWAVARSGGGHLATPWKAVSWPGTKMMGDDQFHTDWMIGAGLELDCFDDYLDKSVEAFRNAFFHAKFKIEEKLLNFRCSVLLQGPFVDGMVIHAEKPNENLLRLMNDANSYDEKPILIIPDARPEWIDLALEVFNRNGALIVEKGGSMAHLVSVFRDRNEGPIVLIPEARKKYPVGAMMFVQADSGSVKLHDTAFSRFANEPDPFGDGRHYVRKPEDEPLPINSPSDQDLNP